MKQFFRVIGSSRVLPSKRIAAETLDQRLGFPPGTTFARTGVRYRHETVAPESATSMAVAVIHGALAEARCTLRDLDQIIDASLCQQQPIPCNAALLQEALGPEAAGIPCYDVHASCLGFVAALQVVNGLFATGAAKRVLVVCAETPLQGVNWEEPESACLMGDGAAAFVFAAVDPVHACALRLETFAEGAHLCEVAGGGHRLPVFSYQPAHEALFRFRMEGKAVHRLASRLLPALVQRVLDEMQCKLEELDVIPHQASGPAIALLSRRLRLPENQVHTSIADHGNLVAASIPYVLHGVRHLRPAGSKVLLIGTAAGYTQAAGIIAL